MGILTVRRTLEPRGPAGALVLSESEVAELSGGKRAPLRVTVGDREVAVRLAVMGGEYLVGLSKAARAELGVEIGQVLDAVIALDEAPREVVVPDDLGRALAADPAAASAFGALSPSARKDFASWVDAAKRPDTRQRRVQEALELIRAGRRRR